MKNWLLLSLVILIFSSNLTSKIIKLPDLINPGLILISKDQVFINDGTSIYIYASKDFSLQKKFGRRGEGPREFRVNPNINKGGVYIGLDTDNIIISSIRRVSVFSRKGDFKKLINPKYYVGKLIPIGKRFVGDGVAHKDGAEYRTINIYGSDMEKEKEIYRWYSWNDRIELDLISYTSFPIVYVNEGRIFVNGKVYDDTIKIFDSQGKKVSTVSHNYKKTKITSADRKKIMNFFQTSPSYKEFIEYYRKLIKFSKYFPAIRHYQVADQKIYIATYKVIEEKREFYIFDTRGKFIKKAMLPLMEEDLIHLYPYTIHKSKLYQLIEGEDGEEWELHITEIK